LRLLEESRRAISHSGQLLAQLDATLRRTLDLLGPAAVADRERLVQILNKDAPSHGAW